LIAACWRASIDISSKIEVERLAKIGFTSLNRMEGERTGKMPKRDGRVKSIEFLWI
jgi:hypothetical protein